MTSRGISAHLTSSFAPSVGFFYVSRQKEVLPKTLLFVRIMAAEQLFVLLALVDH